MADGELFVSCFLMKPLKSLKLEVFLAFPVFPGDIEDASTHKRFEEVAAHLNSKQGPVRKYTKSTEDSDTVIECLTVVAGSYRHAQSECLRWPEVLRPIRGELRVSGTPELKPSRNALC